MKSTCQQLNRNGRQLHIWRFTPNGDISESVRTEDNHVSA